MAIATAKARTVRIAPRKMRLVVDLIRGRKVSEARDILRYTPKVSAPIVLKLLESAVANAANAAAETRRRLDTDAMVISTVSVDEGITMKRWQPAPRGRANRIRLRSSHVNLTISGGE